MNLGIMIGTMLGSTPPLSLLITTKLCLGPSFQPHEGRLWCLMPGAKPKPRKDPSVALRTNYIGIVEKKVETILMVLFRV